MSFPNEVFHAAKANLVDTVANVESEARFASDHIEGSGLGLDFSDRRHQPLRPLGNAFDGADPFCCARNRVTAKMHRGCASMIGTAQECELQPALARNRINRAQWQIEV